MDGTLNFLNLEEKSGKATPFPILFNLGFEILAEKLEQTIVSRALLFKKMKLTKLVC